MENGVKVNGKVPWVIVLAVCSALVGYGILLGQVMQIDARLARIENTLYKSPTQGSYHARSAVADAVAVAAPRMQ